MCLTVIVIVTIPQYPTTQKNSLLLNQHNGDDAPQNHKN